jgi:hypothetical protein
MSQKNPSWRPDRHVIPKRQYGIYRSNLRIIAEERRSQVAHCTGSESCISRKSGDVNNP